MELNQPPPTNKPAGIWISRPANRGMTVFMHILRVLFFIKGLLVFIVGFAFASGATAIYVNEVQLPCYKDETLLVTGIAMLLFSFILFFAAWLCKRVIVRNRYIRIMEESKY